MFRNDLRLSRTTLDSTIFAGPRLTTPSKPAGTAERVWGDLARDLVRKGVVIVPSRDVRRTSRSPSSVTSAGTPQHGAVSLLRLPTGTSGLLDPGSFSYDIVADQYLADFCELLDQPGARHAPTITR